MCDVSHLHLWNDSYPWRNPREGPVSQNLDVYTIVGMHPKFSATVSTSCFLLPGRALFATWIMPAWYDFLIDFIKIDMQEWNTGVCFNFMFGHAPPHHCLVWTEAWYTREGKRQKEKKKETKRGGNPWLSHTHFQFSIKTLLSSSGRAVI